jgi:hypothetical protein
VKTTHAFIGMPLFMDAYIDEQAYPDCAFIASNRFPLNLEVCGTEVVSTRQYLNSYDVALTVEYSTKVSIDMEELMTYLSVNST